MSTPARIQIQEKTAADRFAPFVLFQHFPLLIEYEGRTLFWTHFQKFLLFGAQQKPRPRSYAHHLNMQQRSSRLWLLSDPGREKQPPLRQKILETRLPITPELWFKIRKNVHHPIQWCPKRPAFIVYDHRDRVYRGCELPQGNGGKRSESTIRH